MKKISTYFQIMIFLLITLLIACSTVPFTGRQQLSIIPASQMLSMSYQEYSSFLKNSKVVTIGDQAVMVKRTGQRIQKAVEKYFNEKNMSKELQGYQWEFNLVENPEVNAWCMPGGKVVVYTGLLPIAKSEGELAVVMGHEIAHAIANHGGERMSQQLLVQMGGMALETALHDKPNETKALWMTAFGLGAQLGVILPYSRTHEYEADELGLYFMAMAGYDPNLAVGFWQNMSKAGGAKPPEFLSTHPADDNRIANIKSKLPKVMPYYKP